MFESRTDMEKGTTIMFHHMKCFGLLVHMGRDRGKLRTGALYIPTPETVTTDADKSKMGVDNTDQGYVTFNRKFTYLGFIITDDFEDSTEI
jgi:hypothetical protein